MNGYLPSAIIKRNAKEQLFRYLGTGSGAFLLRILCTFTVAYILSFVPMDSMNLIIIYFIINVIEEIYEGILLAGDNYIALSIATNNAPKISDLFIGFKGYIKKIAGIKLIPALIKTAVFIPFMLSYRNYVVAIESAFDMNELMRMYQTGDIEGMMTIMEPVVLDGTIPSLVALLTGFFFLYIIVVEIINILFSQSLFMLWDYPDKSSTEIVLNSIKLMKNSWGRYLYLQCSFILWDLMMFVTCYLSALWVGPYKRISYANFYLDLMKNKSS